MLQSSGWTGWGEWKSRTSLFGITDTPNQVSAPSTRRELLEVFDRDMAQARASLPSADDAHLMKIWLLLAGGKTLFSMPRIAVLRGIVLNRMVHRRGQLSVCLRLNDQPVPALYGPSADEQR